eukprot:UN11014
MPVPTVYLNAVHKLVDIVSFNKNDRSRNMELELKINHLFPIQNIDFVSHQAAWYEFMLMAVIQNLLKVNDR